MNLRRLSPRFFDWLAAKVIARALRTPYTHLEHEDGRRYMDRFWLFRLARSGGRGEYPWIGLRVHVIHSSDDDRALHDHPWPFLSIILRGGYLETRKVRDDEAEDWARIGLHLVPVVHRRYSAGDVLYRPAKAWHMLTVEGAPAYTLFVTFPMLQEWGFLWRGRKVHHRDFARAHGTGIRVVRPEERASA